MTIDDVLRTKTEQGCEGTGADPNGLIFYATTEVPAAELAEITLETE